MKTIQIEKDPYDFGVNLFPKKNVTFEPGVTVLVGCNGSGKTTLLKELASFLRKEHIPYLKYSNMTEGGSSASGYYGFYGMTDMLARDMLSSEGERLFYNFGELAVRKMAKFIRDEDDSGSNERWILLDAIDSGSSIDLIKEMKDLFQLVIDDNKQREIYIIVGANSFEMTRDVNALVLRNFSNKVFKTYGSFEKEIMKSKEKKNRR